MIDTLSTKPPSQRMLKVGEVIRQALAEIFARDEAHIVGLHGASITVSEVRVSPDLRNATVFVMPLAGQDKEHVLDVLKAHNSQIRNILRKKVILKFFPSVHYKLDNSFEEAGRVQEILSNPNVQRDLMREVENGKTDDEL